MGKVFYFSQNAGTMPEPETWILREKLFINISRTFGNEQNANFFKAMGTVLDKDLKKPDHLTVKPRFYDMARGQQKLLPADTEC